MLFVALASATIASAIKTSPAALRQFGALSTHGVAATRFADAKDAYALLEPIRDAFDELRSVHPDALAPQLEPPAPGTTLHAKDAKFHCYAAGTTRDAMALRADESTLELFEPLAAHFRPHFDMTVSAAGWDGDGDGAPLTVLGRQP
ncbi:voltage-gated potassium channel [Aureococcus anophagefferens]|nr:voltage-gated potassium channel [Aureococcus anophagefferens]